MRRLLLIGTAAVIFATPTCSAFAFVIECPTCAQLGTQTMQLAKQAAMYANALDQKRIELQQFANMVTNTVSLPRAMWAQVQNDILSVQRLSSAGSLLTGNAGGLVSRLNSANGYVGSLGSITNIGDQFEMWQRTIGNNLDTLGRTLGVQQGQERNYAAIQRQLELHSQTAAGQMQAIQAGNELAAMNATLLQDVNGKLTSIAQLEGTQIAVEADRRASEDAAMMRFASPSPFPAAGYKGYSYP